MWKVDVNPIKTAAIIAGAGAVENAWNPILKALQPYHDFPLTADGANSFLARIVYLLRWYAGSPGEFSKQELKKHLDLFEDVKASIITELKAAEKRKEIKARQSLKTLLDRLIVPYSSNFVLVTTNWDTVISKSIHDLLNPNFKIWVRPLHVHGSVAKLRTMYMPSEVTKEPYRERRHDNDIGTVHGKVWRSLETAHRVIIYGLSIDPLDAELGQTLAAGWSNPNLQEILIVDPNHEQISHRVNLLLDRRRDIRVVGLDPGTMDEVRDYTIWRHRTAGPP